MAAGAADRHRQGRSPMLSRFLPLGHAVVAQTSVKKRTFLSQLQRKFGHQISYQESMPAQPMTMANKRRIGYAYFEQTGAARKVVGEYASRKSIAVSHAQS
jgi:hypothetical protein